MKSILILAATVVILACENTSVSSQPEAQATTPDSVDICHRVPVRGAALYQKMRIPAAQLQSHLMHADHYTATPACH